MAKNRVSFDKIYSAYIHCMNCKKREECDTWCDEILQRFTATQTKTITNAQDKDLVELQKYRDLAPLHVVIGWAAKQECSESAYDARYTTCGRCGTMYSKRMDFTFCPDCGQRIKP